MNDTTHVTPQPAPNRKPFFVVLSLFAAPLLLSFAVYYGTGWRPTGTTNKGDLISPAVSLPAVALTTAQGTATDATFLRDKWTLVHIAPGICDDACRTALVGMRDARLLLGKDVSRVSRVFLYSGSCCEAAYFDIEQQGLISASIDSEAGKSLLKLFPSLDEGQPLQTRRTYIVDPLGNLMMSYAAGTDPRSIYQDIKKLLKYSHIG